MNYIDGSDAAQLIQPRYPAGVPAELTIPIITAVASALDYAHKKGLLRRDVNLVRSTGHSSARRALVIHGWIPMGLTTGMRKPNFSKHIGDQEESDGTVIVSRMRRIGCAQPHLAAPGPR